MGVVCGGRGLARGFNLLLVFCITQWRVKSWSVVDYFVSQTSLKLSMVFSAHGLIRCRNIPVQSDRLKRQIPL